MLQGDTDNTAVGFIYNLQTKHRHFLGSPLSLFNLSLYPSIFFCLHVTRGLEPTPAV